MRITAIHITGRRWFQRTYGNTYNSATITVYRDGEEPMTVYLSKAYGYGDYYLQRAADELERIGLMPGREHYPHGGAEPGWQYFRERRNIPWKYEVIDVSRQKDL